MALTPVAMFASRAIPARPVSRRRSRRGAGRAGSPRAGEPKHQRGPPRPRAARRPRADRSSARSTSRGAGAARVRQRRAARPVVARGATSSSTRGRAPRALGSALTFVPPARHLLRAKDLADARYAELLGVDDLARAAGLSRAHFSREFRRVFGESPHGHPRPAAWSAPRRCCARPTAPWSTSASPSDCRAWAVHDELHADVRSVADRVPGGVPPAAAHALVPACVVRAYGRPQRSTFREDSRSGPD